MMMRMLATMARFLLCLLIPAYLSISALCSAGNSNQAVWISPYSSGSGADINSWLRYWVVVSCAAIPEIILKHLQLFPYYNIIKTIFMCWCLLPGPLSGSEIIFLQIFPLFKIVHETGLELISQLSSYLLNNIVVADIAHSIILVWDLLASLENPLNTFAVLCGCLYISQTVLGWVFSRRGREEGESVSVQLSVARVDDSPLVEHTTLTQKIKQKSRKIVMDGEQGEARSVIQKCKKFLSTVQSSNFACKIFINSWEDIDGIKNFDKIVNNIGAQLRLPKDDIEGIRLAAMGGSSRRDYLSFDCAMKDKGQVRLHTGGYSVVKRENEKYDFQIVHHYIDLTELTLRRPSTESREICEAEVGWFRGTPQCPALEHPEEGKDWNTYFQYEAHKNLLKELPEDQDD